MKEVIEKNYAIYNLDCIEGMKQLRDESVHFSIYSPPFGGLYNYSSNEQDLSNCKSYEQFFDHYEYVVREKYRVTMPGRLTAVHCSDVPGNSVSFKDKDRARISRNALVDLPADIRALHERLGFKYHARYAIWKEPLRVAIRTRSKGLTHRQIVKDSTQCNNAAADYILVFRKEGENPVPVTHPVGFRHYSGERDIPAGLVEKFKDWKDPQTNKLAHWIWQQYASSFWDDIRIGRVLPYKHAKEKDEEKHCHPLQLDVIERCLQLWTNPRETVLTPFMGVGSEVYAAVCGDRRGIGFELKASYFRQATANLKLASPTGFEQDSLFGDDEQVEAETEVD